MTKHIPKTMVKLVRRMTKRHQHLKTLVNAFQAKQKGAAARAGGNAQARRSGGVSPVAAAPA